RQRRRACGARPARAGAGSHVHRGPDGRPRDRAAGGDRRRSAGARRELALMCGIAGIVGATASRPTLQAMLTTLEHRGPDDRGVSLGDGVAVGMTRLAIIDLVTGRQPMTSEDGNTTIVFNGEIYNFRALRAELEAGGCRFRTRSDTEVILHAW